MKALLQRVKKASVTVEGKVIGSVGEGYLILLGVREGDTAAEAKFLAQKTAELRVFTDPDGKMNLSVRDVAGGVLAVSNFTLMANYRKGNRPDYMGAASPAEALALYEDFCRLLEAEGVPVSCGRFGAHMEISLVADGPVTIVMDSEILTKNKKEGK